MKRIRDYRDSLTRDSSQVAHSGIHTAIAIAHRFTHHAPTVAQLREAFNMSRATAYRWRRAWLDANGVAK